MHIILVIIFGVLLAAGASRDCASECRWQEFCDPSTGTCTFCGDDPCNKDVQGWQQTCQLYCPRYYSTQVLKKDPEPPVDRVTTPQIAKTLSREATSRDINWELLGIVCVCTIGVIIFAVIIIWKCMVSRKRKAITGMDQCDIEMQEDVCTRRDSVPSHQSECDETMDAGENDKLMAEQPMNTMQQEPPSSLNQHVDHNQGNSSTFPQETLSSLNQHIDHNQGNSTSISLLQSIDDSTHQNDTFPIVNGGPHIRHVQSMPTSELVKEEGTDSNEFVHPPWPNSQPASYTEPKDKMPKSRLSTTLENEDHSVNKSSLELNLVSNLQPVVRQATC